MKTFIIIFLVAALAIVILSGCSTPQFGNAAQYDKEDWHFLANPRQIEEMRQGKLQLEEEKLALNKLASLPVRGDAVNGYEGVVINYSRSNRYTFQISGPEKKAYVLESGESVTDKLISGIYTVKTLYNGSQQGCVVSFRVGPQLSYVHGVWTHWFVYNE